MKGKLLTVVGILIVIVVLYSAMAPTITAAAEQFSKLLAF